jgi:hypothetical protein
MKYELRDHRVSPTKLLLDPNNPRLQSTLHGSVNCRSEEIADDKVQQKVLSEMLSKEHQVETIVDSIEQSGYLNIDAIFVRRLGNSESFLVLEGNRRTAAIKTLVRRPQSLTADVRASLETIPIKELICDDVANEGEIISRILAIRHINGIKEWSPMLRAFQIYLEYDKQYRQNTGESALSYDSHVADVVARRLNIKRSDLKNAVIIARIFLQVRDAGYAIQSDDFSLIEMTVSRPTLLNEYFEFNEDSLRLSEVGVAKMNDLMIDDTAPIRNPTDHRAFFFVFRWGEDDELLDVENGVVAPKDAKAKIQRRQKARELLFELEDIKYQLEAIKIDQFRGVEAEIQLVREIRDLVEKRLVPLVEMT